MRGKKGVKCCGQWMQPCRCKKPCTRYGGQSCACPNCDCGGSR